MDGIYNLLIRQRHEDDKSHIKLTYVTHFIAIKRQLIP